MRRLSLLLVTLLMFALPRVEAEPVRYEFGPWAPGTSPRDIGQRVAERFLAMPHVDWGQKYHYIVYPEVCAWYGALKYAALAGDAELSRRLIARFTPVFQPENAWMVPPINHVDATVFGAVPLEIYRQTGQYRYRELGLQIADGQWDNPTPEGLTPQTRFWIDDMFMITAVQIQAYRATGDRRYLDRTAHEMMVYLQKLQQPNGLFYHAPDVPFFWGRGNGWMAVGMAELLSSMPEDHPERATILAAYRKMMATLLAQQTKEGLWRQLIDRPESWVETSGSGMFTFAFITGVKRGWLDAATYGPAAKRAWLGLITYLDDASDMREICVGTNKKNDYQWYMDRPRKTGDLHGQAPVLWCAAALLGP